MLIRHDLLIDLYLLDKPNILWDNADAEALYNSLATALELSDRFEVVSYKLGSIKDDIIMDGYYKSQAQLVSGVDHHRPYRRRNRYGADRVVQARIFRLTGFTPRSRTTPPERTPLSFGTMASR